MLGLKPIVHTEVPASTPQLYNRKKSPRFWLPKDWWAVSTEARCFDVCAHLMLSQQTR